MIRAHRLCSSNWNIQSDMSFSGYHIPRHMMSICLLMMRLLWIVRSRCCLLSPLLSFLFCPLLWLDSQSMVRHWEFANSPLLIRFHKYCTLWCMCLAWTHLYYHGLQIIYIFFTPSLPSTIISLYTNLRKCSHFSCIWLFPTLFSGLQFTEVLIYVSAQIVFCFSQWEPCQAKSVLTHFYYSPRHFFFFFTFGHMKVFQFYLLYLLCPSPGIRHSFKKLLFLLVGMGT